MKKLSALLAILIAVLLVWSLYQQSIRPSTITASSITASSASSTQAGAATLYPDSVLTPGDVLTTDASIVCKSGYSSSVRNVPINEKRMVYAEYNIPYPQPTGSYEADHFISLELGGSNDIKNLWPEPAAPNPGFHEKDVVENYLHNQVCKGLMPLAEAQREISTDWYAVYLRIQ
ncbi:MAG: hypothetical protein JWN49_268 [Parcubacteria group bacterium]|nr:hypothetical protein [Parcubacteria group bacterium]